MCAYIVLYEISVNGFECVWTRTGTIRMYSAVWMNFANVLLGECALSVCLCKRVSECVCAPYFMSNGCCLYCPNLSVKCDRFAILPKGKSKVYAKENMTWSTFLLNSTNTFFSLFQHRFFQPLTRIYVYVKFLFIARKMCALDNFIRMNSVYANCFELNKTFAIEFWWKQLKQTPKPMFIHVRMCALCTVSSY